MQKNPPRTVQIKLWHWQRGETTKKRSDFLAVEEPLELRIGGKSFTVTMRTPGEDHELAAGLLLTEGIIEHKTDLVEMAHCPAAPLEEKQNILNIFLAPRIKKEFASRPFLVSSSCGVCGKASIEATHLRFPPIQSVLSIPFSLLLELPKLFSPAQSTFQRTGGLHAAGLFSKAGQLVCLREDIGRHNAVDKVIGWGLLNQVDLSQLLLMVSGRASFEIMQKALAARISFVVSVSAPSSLAVEFAHESGQALVGFLRDHSFNIYTFAKRILKTRTKKREVGIPRKVDKRRL